MATTLITAGQNDISLDDAIQALYAKFQTKIDKAAGDTEKLAKIQDQLDAKIEKLFIKLEAFLAKVEGGVKSGALNLGDGNVLKYTKGTEATVTTTVADQPVTGPADAEGLAETLIENDGELPPPAPTYSLAAGATSVDEGATASFTLTTTNVAAGTELAYTLTGVNAADVTGGALTGKATVGADGKATITVALASDSTTEGAETLTVSLDSVTASANTTVNDTSTTPVTPTYTLAADAASVDEGATATFTLTTTNVAAGTELAYTLTGVDASDVTGGALTGKATVGADGKATITVALANDSATEGAETLTVSLDSVTASANATVNDTSTAGGGGVTPVLATDTVSGTIVSGQGTAILTPAAIADFADNDTDATGAVPTGAVSVNMSSATGGQLVALDNGNTMFVADAGVRQGTFTYSVAGISGQTGTVNVTLNTAPEVTAAALAATEDIAATGSVTATDADSDTLTYSFAAGKGTVTNTGADYTYTPNANVNGSDTITVTVNDGYTTVTKDIAVTIAAVDDAPAVVSPAPAAVSVNSGSTVTVDLAQYATDVDSASLTYTADSATTTNGGTIAIAGSTATITYAQGGGSAAVGADSFKFSATDGTTPVSAVSVSLTVANTAPTATDVALSAKTGVTQTVDLSTYVSDAESNTLTPSVVVGSLSSGGSAEVLNGKIVYTSTIGFTGTETLNYSVSDGFGGTSTEETITFTVKANTGGTSGADLLYGSTAAEAIDGLAGDDTIVGGGGLDTITGGEGNDRVTFSDGASQVQGGAGNDTLVVNSDAVASTFDLSSSTQQNLDTSSVNANNTRVVVRAFEDFDASKNSGAVYLNSDTSFSTTIETEAGGDSASTMSVLTGSGNDGLNFTRATGTGIVVQTSDGNDTVIVDNDAGALTGTASGTFSIDGGAGNDTIDVTSTSAVHTIAGGAGNDTVNLGTGNSSVDGGDGNDTIAGNTGKETLVGGAGNDTITSGGGNDSITGDAGDDKLTANSGDDSLYGGDGNDELVGDTTGSEKDYLIGGAGNDTFTMSTALDSGSTGDTLTGGDGTDTVKVTTADAAGTITLSDYTKVTEVESWSVTSDDNDDLIIAAASSGATNITVNENTTTTKNYTVTGLAASATLTVVSSVDNQAFGTVSAALADATGTTDSLTVYLKGDVADTAANNVVTTLTTTGYESVTIDSGVSSGTVDLTTAAVNANVISTLTNADLKTLTLTGASALTISDTGASTAATTINAGAMTGALNITVDNASALAITGGSANDTIALGTTIGNTDTIDGGAGTADKLTATVNALSATTGALRISNVESINLTDATAASTIDVTNISGATTVNFAGDQSLTITNLPASGLAVGIGFAGTGTAQTAGTITASLKDSSGTADALTFQLQSTGTNAGTLVTSGIETVTLSAAAELNATSTFNVNGVVASKIVVSGTLTDTSKIIDLDGATLSTTTTTFDASGYTGAVKVAASDTATTILMKGTNANDSIAGGAGNDTVTYTTFGTAAESIAGGGGTADTLNITSLTSTFDATNIATFEKYNIAVAAGNLLSISVGGAAKDAGLVTSDVSEIVFTGGGTSAGVASTLTINDAFHTNLDLLDASGYSGVVNATISTDDTGADSTVTIKGGSGSSDILTVDYATGATYVPVVSGFETVRITADSNGSGSSEAATFNLTSVTGATTVAFGNGNGGDTNVVNVTNYDGSATLALGHTAGAGNGARFEGGSTFTVTHASHSGTADALNLKLIDTNNAAAIETITATGVETVSVNAGASDSTEDHKISLSGIATTSSAAQTISITGGMSNVSDGTVLTISNVNDSATVINASSYIGDLVISDRGSSAMTITGGTGADNIRMENASDVLDGGTQTTGLAATNGDTLYIVANTLSGQNAFVDLTSSTDQLTQYKSQANAAVQIGFENVDGSGITGNGGMDITGSSTANIITGSANTDIVVAGEGADTITGGAGDDSITLTETTATADKVVVTSASSVDTIVGFNKGVTSGTDDILSFNLTALGQTFVDGDGTAVAAGAADLNEDAAGGVTIGATDNIVILLGATYTDSTALKTALEAGGARAVTWTASPVSGDDFLVVWTDGTDAYVSAVSDTDTTNDTALEAGDATVTNLVKLSGVSSIAASDFVVGNFLFQ